MRYRRLVQFVSIVSLVGGLLGPLAWFRATRALHTADAASTQAQQASEVGAPGAAEQEALNVVSHWSGKTGSVLSATAEGKEWRVVVAVNSTCYGVRVVGGVVSSHPGVVPCPPVVAAEAAGTRVDEVDARRKSAEEFLTAWLTNAPYASHLLADSAEPLPPPGVQASKVAYVSVAAAPVVDREGAVSSLAVLADVSLPGVVERQAWTVTLARGSTRWDVTALVGGEEPSGDRSSPSLGRTPDSSSTTTSTGVTP